MKTSAQQIYDLNLHTVSAVTDSLLIYSNHPDLKKRAKYLKVYKLLVSAKKVLAEIEVR